MERDDPINTAETPAFTKAASFMAAPDLEELRYFVAFNPESGDPIRGTGGCRKLRWAAKGKGKSGGARLIYYYADASMPILLLDLYPKNMKANISQGQAAQLKTLIKAYLKQHGKI